MIETLDKVGEPEPLLVALARRWRVGAEARKFIGDAAWRLVLSTGSNQEKGERLEGLLCFLLGQVADFEVSEHRLNTATEELDVVVTIRGQQRAVLGVRRFAFHSRGGQELAHAKCRTK